MSRFRGAASLERSWKRRRSSGSSFGQFAEWLDGKQIPYLSHSKVTCIERCARCYHRRHVLLEGDASAAMSRGTLFHDAAAALYEEMRHGRSTTATQLARKAGIAEVHGDDRTLLANGISQLLFHRWEGYEVVEVEAPVFLDLDPELPPVLGIVDLVLRHQDSFLVVDHKTTTGKLEPADADQLLVYAEWVRRRYRKAGVAAAFDAYRLVADTGRLRKPCFRRFPVVVEESRTPMLRGRYRNAWKLIRSLGNEAPAASPDCYWCRRARGW